MRMNGSVRAPTATRMSSVPESSLTSPIHARSVPSSSRARATISCSTWPTSASAAWICIPIWTSAS